MATMAETTSGMLPATAIRVPAVRLSQAEHPVDPLVVRGDLRGVLARVEQFL